MSSSFDTKSSDLSTHQLDSLIREKVRTYIIDNLLLGATEDIEDAASLLDSGILDSTGALELVAFLEEEFALTVKNADLTPDNLDSIDRICGFVLRERAPVRESR